MRLWDGILFVSPMAALWCMGVNLLWGHVVTASRIWEAGRERREARRRLRRSVAAWEKFRAEYEGAEGAEQRRGQRQAVGPVRADG